MPSQLNKDLDPKEPRTRIEDKKNKERIYCSNCKCERYNPCGCKKKK